MVGSVGLTAQPKIGMDQRQARRFCLGDANLWNNSSLRSFEENIRLKPVSPSNLKILAEYFVIPLLVLLISYAISGQFNLRYSAGTDFFIFFLSADLGAIIEYEDLRPRIIRYFGKTI